LTDILKDLSPAVLTTGEAYGTIDERGNPLLIAPYEATLTDCIEDIPAHLTWLVENPADHVKRYFSKPVVGYPD